MKAYIKVINGNVVDHPVLEDNLMDVFDCIPPEYAPFERQYQDRDVAINLGPFKRFVHSYVLKADGVTWTDQWDVENVSEEERQHIIAAAKATISKDNQLFYEFNEETCKWIRKF